MSQDPRIPPTQQLIDCYLSGQMAERQWQQHLADNTPGLREAWETARSALLQRRTFTLSDGTDISRKTVEEITIAQRKLSPKFPSFTDALEQRTQLRETIAARTLLAAVPLGLIGAIWSSFGWVVAGFGFVGFVIACFVTGNRHTNRGGDYGQRPF